MLLCTKKCTLTSFVDVGTRSARNAPKNREPTVRFPSRQCSSTPLAFGQGFLSKEQSDNNAAPPYSPDLAPADFYLFRRLKSALKRRHFCNATDIKNATEKLKRLSLNGFQGCFLHLYSYWQKCTVAEGDYFEGNVA
jgi:hypothetical protein